MTDLERRLRAALRAGTEPPPAGLLDAVMRRHRRHRIRLGASVLAVLAAAALALPPVASALRGDGSPTVTSGGGTPAVTSGRHVAAPGTLLSGCGGANLGALGRHWKSERSTRAGPLWFLDGGHSTGPVRLYVAIAVLDGLRPGSVVVARVAPAGRPYLRFLYAPSDSLSSGTRHSMRSGESGVTFVACGPNQQIVRSPGFTDYYGGYLVKGAHCVAVRVWVPGHARPILIHLGACPGH